MPPSKSVYSAAEQGLGYTFQSRFALLKALDLPEDALIYLERNDDVEFVMEETGISLVSLKHKAVGDRLTDLSPDFWKSVRIWLRYYNDSGRAASNAQFLLFSTASISPDSFLAKFTDAEKGGGSRAKDATIAIGGSASLEIAKLREELEKLSEDEAEDFYGRITIFPKTIRISDVPAMIDRRLRTVRKDHRSTLFERLEGWWTDLVIRRLTGEITEPVKVQDISDKLAALADEYKTDNLPITYRNRFPNKPADARNDPRTFVEQLRVLNLSDGRIQAAIIDYYRAFEQRSSWARENLLVSGEVEEYEDRLVEEWRRFREIFCEKIDEESQEDACQLAGRELYLWAETQTSQLRIRERVTEPFVIRGAFHILANSTPSPRVHWHPRFIQRLALALGTAA